MKNKLDINNLRKGFGCIKIGELKQDMIDLLSLNCKPKNIILWEDKIEYIKKHINDFELGIDQFNECVAQIPQIIDEPDYIGMHPSKNSIEFIKRLSTLVIVAVRFKQSGNLAFRSFYPLSETQLNDYIKSGTVVRYNNET
ncbi:MAG: hypothetical protein GYA50_07045 [Eubacteriaceae bacterium]|nr:hypothetical protein [Eubacteriaceae bacterium]